MKIAIIGISGSGKTTLARKLQKTYGIEPLFADSYVWDKNWTEVDQSLVAERVVKELENKKDWIYEGYLPRSLGEWVLTNADIVIYLDYSGFVGLIGVLKRWWKHRKVKRDELPEGCEEEFDWYYFFRTVLFKRENIRLKRHVSEYPIKKLYHLKSRRQLKMLLRYKL